MKKSIVKKIGVVIGVIAAIVIAVGISWLGTCGIIKLITICFGLKFSWPIATGIWLTLWLLGSVFAKSGK